ncbi:hypothetical protein, partial [Zhongshania sp.]|uniref:hypothetical protein n=1 Tax=Zhongshania sp. TaxID=1971902 RepID=UPI0035685974
MPRISLRAKADRQCDTAPPRSGATSSSSASLLSQTKLDDLPGVAPSDINRLSFAAGHVLAGRYTIAELIGQGV